MSTQFNFPANPALNDLFTLPNGSIAQWNGTEWVSTNDQSVTYPLAVALGGTGAVTAAAARVSLAVLGIAGGEAMTGALKLFDGTVAAPGFAFASEPGLGWYRTGSSAYSVASQGVRVIGYDFSTPAITLQAMWPRASGVSDVRLFNQPPSAANVNSMDIAIDATGGCSITTSAAGTATRGSLFLDAPLVSSTGNLFVNKTSPQLILNKATSGDSCVVVGARNNLPRWQIYLGGPDAESGSNTGSNFSVARFDDAGNYVGDSIKIARNSGDATFSSTNVVVNFTPTNGGSALVLNKNTASFNSVYGKINSVTRWQLSVGNASQNFELSRFDSGGAFQGAAITTELATGNTIFTGTVFANVSPPSDERIKSDIVVMEPYANFDAIRPISFIRKADPETGVHYGFSAQNLYGIGRPLVVGDPSATKEDGTPDPAGIDPVGILAMVVLEVHALKKRLTQLEHT